MLLIYISNAEVGKLNFFVNQANTSSLEKAKSLTNQSGSNVISLPYLNHRRGCQYNAGIGAALGAGVSFFLFFFKDAVLGLVLGLIITLKQHSFKKRQTPTRVLLTTDRTCTSFIRDLGWHYYSILKLPPVNFAYQSKQVHLIRIKVDFLTRLP